jgi:hypothetical protein
MPENLRETIEKDEAIMADPNASPEETRRAHWDLKISQRLLSKGVEVLKDGPDEGEGAPEEA